MSELSKPKFFKRSNGDLMFVWWSENIPKGDEWVEITKKEYNQLVNKFLKHTSKEHFVYLGDNK